MAPNEHTNDISVVVIFRSEYVARSEQQLVLQELLAEITELGAPTFLIFSRRNNVSLLNAHLQSPLIQPIVFEQTVGVRQAIDSALSYIQTPYMLVIHSDMLFFIRNRNLLVDRMRSSKALCAVPVLHDKELNRLPNVTEPAFTERREPFTRDRIDEADQTRCFFPKDYVGLYHCHSLEALGGFDQRYESEYWALYDLGCTAGEFSARIVVSDQLGMVYASRNKPIDMSLSAADRRLFEAKHLKSRRSRDGRIVFRRGHENTTIYLDPYTRQILTFEEVLSTW